MIGDHHVSRSESDEVWSEHDVRALGVTTDIPTAAQILGISRSHAYELARRNEFPVPVLRIGSRSRISVGEVLALLGLAR
jgi:predicted DNA-binding transcriptional regulator AlpA